MIKTILETLVIKDPPSWSRIFLFRYTGRKSYAEIFLGGVKQ